MPSPPTGVNPRISFVTSVILLEGWAFTSAPMLLAPALLLCGQPGGESGQGTEPPREPLFELLHDQQRVGGMPLERARAEAAR